MGNAWLSINGRQSVLWTLQFAALLLSALSVSHLPALLLFFLSLSITQALYLNRGEVEMLSSPRQQVTPSLVYGGPGDTEARIGNDLTVTPLVSSQQHVAASNLQVRTAARQTCLLYLCVAPVIDPKTASDNCVLILIQRVLTDLTRVLKCCVDESACKTPKEKMGKIVSLLLTTVCCWIANGTRD